MTEIGLKYGFLGGLLSIALLSVLYVIDPHALLGGTRSLVYALFLLFMVLAVLRTRAELDGFVSFFIAMRTAFLCMLVAHALVTLFDLFMFTLYDPRLNLYYVEEVRKVVMADASLPDDVRQQQLIQAEQAGGPRFKDFLFKYFVFAIFGFLAALLIGVVLKREPLNRS